MIFTLLQFLSTQLAVKIPKAFLYSSTRMLFASMTSLVLTIVLGPLFIRKLCEMKIGHTVRVANCEVLAEKYVKSKNTPTMGGIFIVFSIVFSALLWMDLSSVFTVLLIFVSLTLAVIGGTDDYLKLKKKSTQGLSGKVKFFMQLPIALLIGFYLLSPALQSSSYLAPPVAKEITKTEIKSLSTNEYAARYYMPFVKKPLFILGGVGLCLGVLMSTFVMIGSINAVNLTDGLDGLATGCALFVSLVLAVVAFLSNHVQIARYLNILYIEGSGEIAIFLSATMGACLGFLWYNGYPAQVFMGDTGSLALGGILGLSAILLRREFLFALVAGVFVIEALSVILQVASFKLRKGKRIFLCAPLHHHFEYKGWPETKVVVRFWMIGLLLALIGLASLKIQ